MSTRAGIIFQDEFDRKIHIDRSHDGFPNIVLQDIRETLNLCKGRWSGSEVGQLVSHFLGLHFNPKQRIQDYEPCAGEEMAGDESYCYWVKWNNQKKIYEYGLVE